MGNHPVGAKAVVRYRRLGRFHEERRGEGASRISGAGRTSESGHGGDFHLSRLVQVCGRRAGVNDGASFVFWK
jgi:hypothetical protein